MKNMRYKNMFVIFTCLIGFAAAAQPNIYEVSGNVGIGISSPNYKLDVYGNSNNYKARFAGPDGYVLIGPANTSWAHFVTDRPAFYFSTDIYNFSGKYSSYSTADLHLQTNGSTRLAILNSNGNVGIGTSSPQIKLDIQGAGAANTDLRVNGRIQTGDGSNLGGIWVSTTSSMFMGQLNANSLGLYNGGWRLIADNNGNVGIGTTSPTKKLTVNGAIYGKEILVDTNVPGPDYVFEKDYDLPSLEEVKSYIEKNKHLPEVPSAKEMEANGINVGEMNMILLKKVEELTLYVIELKKENEAQNEMITELKKKK
jgi:hypothetical protein